MKKFFLLLVLFMLPVAAAALDPIEWPNDPVISLMGASGANERTPEASPFAGMHVGGGGYTDLGEAMTALDMQVINKGEAGAYSFDIPGTGWHGYQAQLAYAMIGGNFNGVQHVKAAVFDPMNDCLHTQPCGEAGMDYYIANLDAAVNDALSVGLDVVVMQLMPFDRIDIALAVGAFTDYTISAEDYALMVSKHEAAFANRPGVIYLDAYRDVTTIDGLHPDAGSMKKAAHRIKKALK